MANTLVILLPPIAYTIAHAINVTQGPFEGVHKINNLISQNLEATLGSYFGLIVVALVISWAYKHSKEQDGEPKYNCFSACPRLGCSSDDED
jgi:hypothetical protein